MDTPVQPPIPPIEDEGGSSAADAQKRPENGLIAVLICTVGLVFLCFVGTLYYNSWLHRPEPKGNLVIEGGPDFQDVHVQVKSLTSETYEGVLTAEGQFKLLVLLDAGMYDIRVWRGTEIYYPRIPFEIKEYQTVKLPLKLPTAATRPAGR